MCFNSLLDFIDELDNKKFFFDADSIQKQVVAAKNNKRIGLIIAPLVALMLSQWMKEHHKPIIVKPAPSNAKNQSADQNANFIVEIVNPEENFNQFVNFLDEHEGGISNRNHRHDPGRLTNQGVTQKVYNEYRHKHHLPRQSVVKMSPDERKAIIKHLYWDQINGDKLPFPIAMTLADWKWNGGFAPIKLQKILGMPKNLQTNKIDNNTIYYLNQISESKTKLTHLINEIQKKRKEYLASTTTKNKHGKVIPLAKYNPGWFVRVDNLTKKVQNWINSQKDLLF